MATCIEKVKDKCNNMIDELLSDNIDEGLMLGVLNKVLFNRFISKSGVDEALTFYKYIVKSLEVIKSPNTEIDEVTTLEFWQCDKFLGYVDIRLSEETKEDFIDSIKMLASFSSLEINSVE